MKPIEFVRHIEAKSLYVCITPEIKNAEGKYYPAAEVERLVRAAKEVVEDHSGYLVTHESVEELKAALAAFEKGE